MNAYHILRNYIRDNIFYPVWYRIFGHKFHIVKTALTPRPWIDTDQRMLYAVMALVKWFVENDMQTTWTKDEYEEECKSILKIRPNDEYEELKGLKAQFEADQKILEVYNWWISYPDRLDEIEEAMHKYWDYRRSFGDDGCCFLDAVKGRAMNADEKAKSDRLFKIHCDLQDKLDVEEQTMLKQAVEFRNCMWS